MMYTHRIYLFEETRFQIVEKIEQMVGCKLEIIEGTGTTTVNTMSEKKEAPNPLKYWVEWTSQKKYGPKTQDTLIHATKALHYVWNEEIND